MVNGKPPLPPMPCSQQWCLLAWCGRWIQQAMLPPCCLSFSATRLLRHTSAAILVYQACPKRSPYSRITRSSALRCGCIFDSRGRGAGVVGTVLAPRARIRPVRGVYPKCGTCSPIGRAAAPSRPQHRARLLSSLPECQDSPHHPACDHAGYAARLRHADLQVGRLEVFKWFDHAQRLHSLCAHTLPAPSLQ
jgi:hypothetical protein